MSRRTRERATVVFLHAHPDDEALWTGGTIARLSDAGHRVVLITATDGDAGLASAAFRSEGSLATHRARELEASAEALGVARLETLGYADSGHLVDATQRLGQTLPFSKIAPEAAAERVAEICREEQADLLVGYDPRGGYGHKDHVMVHTVARLAQELSQTPRLLEATLPRETVLAWMRRYHRFRPLPYDFDWREWESAFTPKAEITHISHVGRYATRKRQAMRCHASQATASDGTLRTMDVLLRIPRPAFDLVFAREFYTEPDVPRRRRPRTDLLASSH